MSNIRKVAELAGVSVATVSRSLATPEMVSPKTRAKVLDAVERAGYRPNQMAVKFRSQRTHNLVVLVPTIANTFYARVISGIQETARKAGYSVLLCNTQGQDEVERDYARLVSSRQADGIIQLRAFNPFSDDDPTPPMVNACELLDNAPCPTVGIDNRGATYELTRHLIELGHRRIAMIQGPGQSPLTRERNAGYQEALEAAGLEADPGLFLPGNFTPRSGFEAARHLVDHANRPTAVVCESDEMAIGAVQCFKEAGLRVPGDISVAGFDDIEFASFIDPPLTTISQPAERFGQEAVARLIEVIEGKRNVTPHQTLPHRLVIRRSTAAAPPR
ncbi:LacI family DNA-binding transcriptional regulator [Larsenimonas suaedae]|uniref:LacI family DNA-binding transcriptional regulator n=1 Tax=Larsenimonas suaedae TaxID=1851019 RepID=A0ABU1GVQ5_9GAMM|nr:LacI family DNA-binding transcriptional regulator [Larsenimonas suaedae]MCM2973195.1 LacI family transcriptional regulator [Larsenimonas suaedae]MDR5896088.1 LacI family DNA-binding transcriptional regulator [Larsenimonas suaedae]